MTWIYENYIELISAVAGILYVILEIRQNIWLWPLGIITSALYIIVFYNSGLYADMGLQWYYLFISIYGWILWSEKENNTHKVEAKSSKISFYPTNINLKQATILGTITLVLFVAIRFVLVAYTDSTVPTWDAFTTALSITATWMLAQKIIEHWLVWVIVNIVSVALYVYKGLYPTVALFIVYAIMAVIGYSKWKKSMNLSKA